MLEFIKIAWRNIWRNRSRTLITISAVAFATFFALTMRSFQLGTYDNMICNFIEMYSGYITIEHPLYSDDPVLENSIVNSDSIEKAIVKTENVEFILPKLTYFSLSSFKKQTKGVLINGIDVENQDKVSKISDKIVKFRITESVLSKLKTELTPELFEKTEALKGKSFTKAEYISKELEIPEEECTKYQEIFEKHASYPGKYLTPKDKGVIIGNRLSEYLKINTGDTLVLLGSGYQGVTAADKFPVRGIVKIANPKLDRTMVYSSLKNVQNYLSCTFTNDKTGKEKHLLSSYAVYLKDHSYDNVIDTKVQIKSILNPDKYIARDWKEANKELAQQIQSDDQSGQMLMGILYLVIGFGIFGTVLMMTAERKREMGVMIAVGLRKTKLAAIISLELTFLGLTGLIAGFGLSTPLILLGYYNPVRLTGEAAESMSKMGFEPVMGMAWFDSYMLEQAEVVIVIMLLVMIYPVWAISKIKVANALRA